MTSQETLETGRPVELHEAAAGSWPITIEKAPEPRAGRRQSARELPLVNTAGHIVVFSALDAVVARRVRLFYRLNPFHSQPIPRLRRIRPETESLTRHKNCGRGRLCEGTFCLIARFDHAPTTPSDNRYSQSRVITRAMNSGARTTSLRAAGKNSTALVSISLDGDIPN